MRPLILKIYDPQINYKIGKSTITLPLSHNLPMYQLLFGEYCQNLGRLSAIVKEKYKNLTMIDIGANVGDTIALLRKYSKFSVLAIEGNSDFFKILIKNSYKLKLTDPLCVLLGKSNNQIKGKMSLDSGTAYFVKSEKGSSVEFTNLDTVLSKNVKYLKSKLLKIDTDGYDFDILLGSLNYIQKTKPIIYLEFDPYSLKNRKKDYKPAIRMLINKGYKNILIFDNYGDFVLKTELDNSEIFSDLIEYASGRNSRYYYDICIFHKNDNDLCSKIRTSEKKHFLSARG